MKIVKDLMNEMTAARERAKRRVRPMLNPVYRYKDIPLPVDNTMQLAVDSDRASTSSNESEYYGPLLLPSIDTTDETDDGTTTFQALTPPRIDTTNESDDATTTFQAVAPLLQAVAPPQVDTNNNEKADDPANGIFYFKFKIPPPKYKEPDNVPTSPNPF